MLSRASVIVLLCRLFACGSGSVDDGAAGDPRTGDPPAGADTAPGDPTTNGDPITGAVIYDLYGTDTQSRGTIPFAVHWPSEPNAITTVTVSTSLELATALATPGARVEVAAGSYPTLALSQDDQHWVLDDGAIFSGMTTTNRPTRVIVEGGVIDAGSGNSITLIADDLVLKNVRISSVGTFSLGANAWSGNPAQPVHRAAIIHCTIVAHRVALFTPGDSIAAEFGEDIIVAANYLQGGMDPAASGAEPALRIMSTTRAIIVDNRARCGFDGQGIKHTYRSHYGNHNYWMRRNMTEYGDGIYFQPRANQDPIETDDHMGAHWVYDHVSYIPSSNPSLNAAHAFRQHVDSTNWYAPLVAVDNTGYDHRQTGVEADRRWMWNGQSGDTITGNVERPYEAPPALGDWLAADGLPPGADH